MMLLLFSMEFFCTSYVPKKFQKKYMVLVNQFLRRLVCINSDQEIYLKTLCKRVIQKLMFTAVESYLSFRISSNTVGRF